MKSSQTVAINPKDNERPPRSPRRRLLMRRRLFAAIALVVAGVMLWNWNGFWQTNVPGLNALQQAYFPVKHAQEQDKLANSQRNTVRWVRALQKIEALEEENEKLKAALEACERRAPARKSDRAY